MRRAALVALVALGVVAALARGVGAEEREGDRGPEPWDGYLPVPSARRNVSPAGEADPDAGVVAVRIVDLETGNPVSGARLRLFAEDVDPHTVTYARLLRESRAGEAGIAWLPSSKEDPGGHFVADAPGYAPTQEFGFPRTEIRLRRGRRVDCRLLGPLGEPLAGAEVEVYHGCPHGPALLRARSDEAGRLTLDGVDLYEGHVWLVPMPGVASELSLDVADLCRRGVTATDVALSAGITVRGQVVDANDEPVPGAAVRADDEARGPAIRTDAEGRFVLHGISASEAVLHVFPPRDAKAERVTVRGVTALAPVRVRLEASDPESADVEDGEIAVEVTAPEGLLRDVALRLIAPDGSSVVTKTDTEEGATAAIARFEVPPGRYRLLAATPFQPLAFEPVDVLVVAGKTAAVSIRGTPKPLLAVEGDAKDAALSCDGHDVVSEDRAVWLPPDAPAALRRDGVVAPVGPAKDGRRAVRLDRPAARRVSWSPDWPVERAQLVLDERGVMPEFAEKLGYIETTSHGPMTLLLELEPEGEWRISLDVLPGTSTFRADGTIPPPRSPRARVSFRTAERGPAPEDVKVVAVSTRTGEETLSVFGAESPVDVEVPCEVTVSAPGWRTLRARADLAGEHHLEWGPAGVDLTVVGPDGQPLDAVVMVRDGLHRADGGRLLLRGLPAEKELLVVSPTTTAHGAVWMRAVLRAGEVRPLRIRLPAR